MKTTAELAVKTDPLCKKAIDLIIESKRISPSFVQRRLGIGYQHADRLVAEAVTTMSVSYELLEALQKLHERYVLAIGNEGIECLAARAAIDKATGGNL